uniref:Caspase-3 n=1 Tax=Gasterosteus aculeatus aculeatus TaxID=481459 RepID=A0AAQ4Q4Q7_GASAC
MWLLWIKRYFMKQALHDVSSPSPRLLSRTNLAKDKYRYKMDYPCMGTCVIINIKNFDLKTGSLETRNGTDVDAAELEKTFSKLGYKVTLVHDQTADQIVDLLRDVSTQDHSNSGSFVCVLLSRGDEGGIYGTDGSFVNLDELTKFVDGNGCRSLVGKPKLLFIQAARGNKLDDGTLSEGDSMDGQTPSRIPVEADFLYAYSTTPGFNAWRDTQNGSWFMQSLCEMLRRFSGQLELMQIMTRVNNKVALEYKTTPGRSGKRQMPCIVSLLTKEFYFP